MRIVSGMWRGRVIKTPQGDSTRPTYDRVREAVISIIFSDLGSFDNVRALDAFAGSGALSFEMLSRGAASATLIDSASEAINCIKENARTLGASEHMLTVLRADAFACAERGFIAGSPFDVVLLDPPYATEESEVQKLLHNLEAANLLTNEALIVYEHEGAGRKKKQRAVPNIAPSANFVHVSQHVYGKTLVDTFHWYEEAPRPEDEVLAEDMSAPEEELRLPEEASVCTDKCGAQENGFASETVSASE